MMNNGCFIEELSYGSNGVNLRTNVDSKPVYIDTFESYFMDINYEFMLDLDTILKIQYFFANFIVAKGGQIIHANGAYNILVHGDLKFALRKQPGSYYEYVDGTMYSLKTYKEIYGSENCTHIYASFVDIIWQLYEEVYDVFEAIGRYMTIMKKSDSSVHHHFNPKYKYCNSVDIYVRYKFVVFYQFCKLLNDMSKFYINLSNDYTYGRQMSFHVNNYLLLTPDTLLMCNDYFDKILSSRGVNTARTIIINNEDKNGRTFSRYFNLIYTFYNPLLIKLYKPSNYIYYERTRNSNKRLYYCEIDLTYRPESRATISLDFLEECSIDEGFGVIGQINNNQCDDSVPSYGYDSYNNLKILF